MGSKPKKTKIVKKVASEPIAAKPKLRLKPDNSPAGKKRILEKLESMKVKNPLSKSALARAERQARLAADVEQAAMSQEKARIYHDQRRVSDVEPDTLRRIIFEGLEPDMVLGKVMMGGLIGVAVMKVADSPIDYLFRRSAKPISELQYQAAVQFREMRKSMGSVGSNTQNILNASVKAVNATKEEKELKAFNRQMKAGTETRPVVDPTNSMLSMVGKLKAIERKLGRLEISLLRDLLDREYTLGTIALRYGFSTEGTSVLVRKSLWDLTRAMEEASAEFAAYSAAINMAGQE